MGFWLRALRANKDFRVAEVSRRGAVWRLPNVWLIPSGWYVPTNACPAAAGTAALSTSAALAADPTFSITTVGLLEVVTVGSPKFCEVCATVAPASSVRTGVTASKDLNMSCSLGDCLLAGGLAVPLADMGALSRLRTVRKLLMSIEALRCDYVRIHSNLFDGANP